MIKVFEAVTEENGNGFRLFLAGGITNCPDWKSILIEKIKNTNVETDLDIYNPRRKNFPIHDKEAGLEQMKWEFKRLKQADMTIYWFSRGSLNPISLYELGMWGNSRTTPVIIGIDEKYERSNDVITQTTLARSNVPIVDSLDKITEIIKTYVDEHLISSK